MMKREFVAAVALFAAADLAPFAEKSERQSLDLEDRHGIRFIGAEAGDELGVQVRFGDLNGDGYDEVILGAWLADGTRNDRGRSGEVYVFFGRPSEQPNGSSLAPTVIYGRRPGDRIGSSVDTGDFNADGATDLLIGARYANGPADSLRHRAGEAFILFGSSTGETKELIDLRERPDILLLGAETGDRLGRRILVQDLDQDGRDDLILAAIGSDGRMGENPDAGAIYVLYGQSRGKMEGIYDLLEEEIAVLHGSDESDGLGGAIAVGDWNDDGVPDLILGCGFADGPANGRTNAGETYVLFGERGSRLTGQKTIAEGSELTIYGAEEYDAAGVSVAAGDLDGDGIDDIAIGANLADGPGNGRDKCGEAYVLFGNRSIRTGQTIDLSYAADLTLFGHKPGDQLGSVLELFDWNGDSYEDLVVASLLHDGPGEQREDAGMLFVVLGARQGALRPRIDLAAGEADLSLLGPSAHDKIATTITHGRLAGHRLLFAATMLGDGPSDERPESGEVYLLRWRPLGGE